MKTGSKNCPAKAKASSCFLTKEEKKNVVGKALNNNNYSLVQLIIRTQSEVMKAFLKHFLQ